MLHDVNGDIASPRIKTLFVLYAQTLVDRSNNSCSY